MSEQMAGGLRALIYWMAASRHWRRLQCAGMHCWSPPPWYSYEYLEGKAQRGPSVHKLHVLGKAAEPRWTAAWRRSQGNPEEERPPCLSGRAGGIVAFSFW